MKILFFMGRNSRNRSGVSWKIWKIGRKGRVVTVSWGPALLKRRKPVLARSAGVLDYRFGSLDDAERFETKKINEKLSKGYQRRTRWR
jgi:predicted DNA-binding WGR domain protein